VSKREYINLADIDEVFSNASVEELIGKWELREVLSDRLLDADPIFRKRIDHLARGIRQAARQCLNALDVVSDRDLRRQIEGLYNVAHSNKFEIVAERLEALSPRAREWLESRLTIWNQGETAPAPEAVAVGRNGEVLRRARTKALELPTPQDLRSEERRGKACRLIASLCLAGGRWKEGKSGWEIDWDLYAPIIRDPQARAKRRDAERELVDALRQAWLVATGEPPADTASETNPGPFVRLVAGCLDSILPSSNDGASVRLAAVLINELHDERQKRSNPTADAFDWSVDNLLNREAEAERQRLRQVEADDQWASEQRERLRKTLIEWGHAPPPKSTPE
jgi:hypothetical protein